MIPKQTITKEELEKKKLKLEEEYNFKQEKDSSWSFVYLRKKAIIVNLMENKQLITPFIIRRGQLGKACDKIYADLENDRIRDIKTEVFIRYSMEIIGNLLDNTKMGSTENFINHLWNSVKETEPYTIIKLFGDIVTMIDYATEEALKEMPKKEMQQLHDLFFAKVGNAIDGVYMVHPDGSIQKLESVDPEQQEKDEDDPYGLKYMKPLNTKEI